ncbi:hypothetical protein EBX93_17465, partial [bacterium]|nr:hypothetical protein [bacterium]
MWLILYKEILLFDMKYLQRIALLLAIIFCSVQSYSQYTATWAFTANNTGVKAGTNAADISIADASIGSTFTTNLGYSANGVKCQPTTGNNWPITPTDDWHIDFPISPVGNIDAELTGLTFAARTSGSSNNNMVSLALSKDGGAFIPFGSAQSVASGGASTVNFPAFSRKLYNNHSYVVRMYMYAASSGTSASRSLTIKNLVFNGVVAVAGTQPTVSITSATATGKYTATVLGNVTAGTYTIVSSGCVWDVSTNPTIALSTKNATGPTTTNAINSANGGAISSLNAGATYHTRTYVESETGDVFYSTDLSFTTNAPTTPILTTNAATNITSIKATSGGVVVDSGGVNITAKGICWSTSTNPTILNSKTADGSGNG